MTDKKITHLKLVKIQSSSIVPRMVSDYANTILMTIDDEATQDYFLYKLGRLMGAIQAAYNLPSKDFKIELGADPD